MKRSYLTVLLLYMCLSFIWPVASMGEDISQIHGYEKQVGYVYIQMGTYPMERNGKRGPVIWRVLSAENNEMFAISEYILDIHQIIECDNKNDAEKTRKFRRIADYGESDLNIWMNSDMLSDLCSEQDFSNALIETRYGKLAILDYEQATNTAYGFTNSPTGKQMSRASKGTEYARTKRIYPDWGSCLSGEENHHAYWIASLRSPDDPENCIKMHIVGGNGHISAGVYTRVNIGVRPVITVDMTKLQIVSGTGTVKDPYIISILAE